MRKWGYKETGEAEIFDLADGEDIPEGWRDLPYTAEEVANSTEPEPTKEELQAIAGELGIKVDGRWNIDRLRQEIASVDRPNAD